MPSLRGIRPVSRLVYAYPSLPDRLHSKLSRVPAVFSALVVHGAINLALVDALELLNRLLLSHNDEAHIDATRIKQFLRIKSQCYRVLQDQDLPAFEIQLCIAIICLCMQLTPRYQHQSNDPSDQETLGALASAFINAKLSGAKQSQAHTHALIWCSLVIGSFLLLQPMTHRYLRAQGHIVLVIAARKLLPESAMREWTYIENSLTRLPCNEALRRTWRQAWESVMERHRVWLAMGLMAVGVPFSGVGEKGASVLKDVDDEIEYLLLRAGRESLPDI